MMQSKLLTKPNVAAIGEEITHELGAQFIKDYQAAYPLDVQSYVIGKDIINQILAQPGCSGIRFYNAVNEFGQKTLVYAGLDADGKVMVNYPSVNNLGNITFESGIVGDRSDPFPSADDTWWLTC